VIVTSRWLNEVNRSIELCIMVVCTVGASKARDHHRPSRSIRRVELVPQLRCADTHNIALDEHLLHLPKPLSVGRCLIHLSQRHIHEVVAFDEMAVERHSVLELDELESACSKFLSAFQQAGGLVRDSERCERPNPVHIPH